MTSSAAEYSWNVFRYLGDFLHLASVLVVIFTLIRNQNSRGLSFKTQLFYLIIFLSRYMDMWTMTSHSSHSVYLYVFKIFYICSAAGIVFVMRRWAATIETNKDTCSYLGVLVPCLIATMVSFLTATAHSRSVTLFFWTFSEFLEAFAMLPQYIFSYRQDVENRRSDKGVLLFILLVGSYRVLYAVNWIYKKIMLGSAYSDSVSWIGGVIEILLFADFLLNRDFLKLVVLSVDTKINEISSQIEMKILRRPPQQEEEEHTYLRSRKGQARLEEDEAMLMI
jgi:ER lumen protein retaining receptor